MKSEDIVSFAWLQESDVTFKEVVADVLTCLCYGTDSTLPSDISRTTWLGNLLVSIATKGMTGEQVEKEFSTIEGLSPEDAKFIVTEANKKKSNIRQAVVNETINNMPNAVNQFDWNVKYGVSSSKVLSLNACLCTLTLMHSSNKDVNRLLQTELTQDQLDVLLEKLKIAQSKIAKIK